MFNRETVTLKALIATGFLAVLDNVEEGDIIAGVECATNGTWPQANTQDRSEMIPNEAQGYDPSIRQPHLLDRNGDAYRWSNFLVVTGEQFDEIKEAIGGMDVEVTWQELYDMGITSSSFERDLHKEVPRGAKCNVMVMRQDDRLNIVSYSVNSKDASEVSRFNNNRGKVTLNGESEDAQREAETA